MRWTDGSAYEGEWNRGLQHGSGVMMFANGTRSEGYFDNNVFVCKEQRTPHGGMNELKLEGLRDNSSG